MSLFGDVVQFVSLGTISGGRVDDFVGGFSGPDYNQMFDSQLALYNQELKRRTERFNAQDVTNSNTAATTILTGGSKPIGGNGAAGNDFTVANQRREERITKVAGNDFFNLNPVEGLTTEETQVARQRQQQRLREAINGVGGSFGL